MSASWHEYLDGLTDKGGLLDKEALKQLVVDMAESEIDFAQKMAKKMEKYLGQLAREEIDADEFKMFTEDLVDLRKIDEAQLSVQQKATVQRYANKAKALLLDGLLKLIS